MFFDFVESGSNAAPLSLHPPALLPRVPVRCLVHRYGVFGETLTHFVLGKTFFAHFCAGETAEQVGRRAGDLQKVGIGGILDYAAEVDLRPAEERAEREAKKRAAGDNKLLLVVSVSLALCVFCVVLLCFLASFCCAFRSPFVPFRFVHFALCYRLAALSGVV